MTRYAAWWSGWWGLVAAVGLGMAFVVWSPGEVATLLCTATLCAGVLLALLVPGGTGDRPQPALPWSRLCSRALVAGAGVVVVAAYAAALPSLGWPLACLAALTSPPIVDRALRRRTSRRAVAGSQAPDRLDQSRTSAAGGRSEAPAQAEVVAVPAPAPPLCELSEQQVRELGTPELCQRWRRSFLALEKAGTATQRMRVVAQRQLFLDEMDRRSPTALAAWLASGARAAGGPERYLSDDAA